MKQAGSHTQAVDPVNNAAAADTNLQHAALIALDWGTTSLRAYLYDAAGDVLATRASTAGIMNCRAAPSKAASTPPSKTHAAPGSNRRPPCR